MRLVDIHAHIHQHDRVEAPGIVARATDAGVSVIVTAGTDLDDSRRAIELAREYPRRVFAGVGVHPSEMSEPLSQQDISELDVLTEDESVVVMSEVGIDHMPNSPNHAWQEEAFDRQIEIALAHELPVVFHARESKDDMSLFDARGSALSILERRGVGDTGGAAHYFQGDWEYARRVLDLGLHVSFAKPLLRMRELQDVARRIPMEMALLESDSYPQWFKKNRERWTEPKDVLAVAECLAELRGLRLEEVCERTTANALRLLTR